MDLGGERDKDSPINIVCGDLYSQIAGESHLDVATENWFMLQMMLKIKAQWKTKQKPGTGEDGG